MILDVNGAIKQDDIVTKYSRAFSLLQANILQSHGRDNVVHAFLSFVDPEKDRRALRAAVASIRPTSAMEQYTQSRTNPFGASVIRTFSLSGSGYRHLLGKSPFFGPVHPLNTGMKRRKWGAMLPQVEEWELPYQRRIDAMLMLASDSKDMIEEQLRSFVELFSSIAEVHLERGCVLRNKDGEPVEHFGFQDGVSQPVFFEHKLPAARDRWNPEAAPRLVLLRDPLAEGVDEYGSYLSYLKIEQDVQAFQAAVRSLAAAMSAQGKGNARQAEELAGAFLLGRFKSGTPVVAANAPNIPESNPNNFDYRDDHNAYLRCPAAAHIRKVNPRDSEERRKHRIARRGVTYGDLAGEGSTGQERRGLLFQCYQWNISDQFEFLMQAWMNDPDHPRAASGVDPIMGRGSAVQPKWPKVWGGTGTCECALPEFTKIRGGEYFFTPSTASLWRLGQKP